MAESKRTKGERLWRQGRVRKEEGNGGYLVRTRGGEEHAVTLGRVQLDCTSCGAFMAGYCEHIEAALVERDMEHAEARGEPVPTAPEPLDVVARECDPEHQTTWFAIPSQLPSTVANRVRRFRSPSGGVLYSEGALGVLRNWGYRLRIVGEERRC